ETSTRESDPAGSPEEVSETDAPPALVHGASLTVHEDNPRTLPEMLERAAHSGKEIIYIHNRDEVNRETYRDVLLNAKKVANGLEQNGCRPGDKIIFQFSANEDFVAGFWGCMLGGFVPVPLTPASDYSTRNSHTEKVYRTWRLLGEPCLLVSDNLYDNVSAIGTIFKTDEMKVLRISKMRAYPPSGEVWKANPEDPVILLFTSGSTGTPKGVIQNHRTIMSLCMATADFNHFSGQDISLNWMPLDHVGGIIMFHIRDVYLRCTQIHVPRELILARPLLWLDFIDRYKATITWAPNFAFNLVNGLEEEITRGRWDLSSLYFILNAGEMIVPRTVRKFLALLKVHKLREDSMKPAYGMSETSSAITYWHGCTPGTVKDEDTFLPVGFPIPGLSMRIVDDENGIKREGEVGRLQVKGATVTSGYYNNPGATESSYTEDGWFDTGDLGYIRDRNLTLTGRMKDVIIINGINYYSQEIESVVEEMEGAERSFCAACAVKRKDDDTDRCAIFFTPAEGYADDPEAMGELCGQIRKTVFKRCGINPEYIIPIRKEDFPKTDIGKIQRARLKMQFEEGMYNSLLKESGYDPDRTGLTPWFYEKKWRPEAVSGNGTDIPGHIAVVMGKQPLCSHILDILKSEHISAVPVLYGKELKIIDGPGYVIRNNVPDDCVQVFDLILKEKGRIDAVINIVSDTECNDSMEEDTFMYMTNRILDPVKAMSVHKPGNRLRYLVVTEKTFSFRNDEYIYCNGIVQGLVMSAGLELDYLTTVQIDLEHMDKTTTGAVVLDELKNGVADQIVAYRDNTRFIPYFEHAAPIEKEEGPDTLEENGFILVTGGLGGVGYEVSRWLLDRAGKDVLIIGRTPVNDSSDPRSMDKKKLLETLEGYRGRVKYESGHITDYEFLKRVTGHCAKEWGKRLTGIFHLAGILSKPKQTGVSHWEEFTEHFITCEPADSYSDVYQTKIKGVIALNKLRQDDKTMLMVVFSSVNGHFGGAGLSAYAAGNSFIEHYCDYIRQEYPRTYCLHWTMWENIGMSQNAPQWMIDVSSAKGFGMIKVSRGLLSLSYILANRIKNCFIGLDNRKIPLQYRLYGDFTPVLNVFYTSGNEDSLPAEKVNGILRERLKNDAYALFIERVESIPRNTDNNLDINISEMQKLKEKKEKKSGGTGRGDDTKPMTELEKEMAEIWHHVLGVSDIGINSDFFELGGNSIKAISLASLIKKELEIDFAISELFEKPTIGDLCAGLSNREKRKFTGLKKASEREYYPTTSQQKGIFAVQEIHPSQIVYNMPGFFILKGELDIHYVEDCLCKLIERHDALRTEFEYRDNELVQRICKKVDFHMEFRELSGPPEQEMREFIRPFDLRKAPLMRCAVFKVKEQEFLFCLDLHHIIGDAATLDILIRDFTLIYNGEILPALEFQFVDYVVWLEERFRDPQFNKQKDFWLQMFDDDFHEVDIPADYPGPGYQTFDGRNYDFVLDKEMVDRLKSVCKKYEVTLYMLLFAMFNVFVSKYADSGDITIGSPLIGRDNSALKDVAGIFVNTQAFRSQPGKSKSFAGYLLEIKKLVLGAYENQLYPFEKLVKEVKKVRTSSGNPMYNIVFILQNVEIRELTLNAITIEQYKFNILMSPFELIFSAREYENEVSFSVMYNTGLYKDVTIELMCRRFKVLIQNILDDTGCIIGNLSFEIDEERHLKEKTSLQLDNILEEF
ncbi:MAG: SDR family NAD(P)-dependent oxidoreductase, partial [Spirochaetales bacterium]|nr:SDR family NAD(P)-dependent oxidoreductase [Spirochaetales bacterium]